MNCTSFDDFKDDEGNYFDDGHIEFTDEINQLSSKFHRFSEELALIHHFCRSGDQKFLIMLSDRHGIEFFPVYCDPPRRQKYWSVIIDDEDFLIRSR